MFNCVHPLLFGNNDPNFPYTMQGSGFLVEFNNRLFFVTAHHCLRNLQYTPEQLKITPHSASKEVINFDRQYAGRSLVPDDPDRADLLILHVNIRNSPLEALQGLLPFHLSSITCGVPGGSPDLQYRAHGYPASSCEVDYDSLRITGRTVILDLQHNGPASSISHVHKFTYPKDDCADPNGLSGSPVFGMITLDPKHNLTQLIGLVIRGGNGNIYALDSRLVAEAIFNAAKREDERN